MRQLKKDVIEGMDKDQALEAYLARGGDPMRGTMILSAYPDAASRRRYTYANYWLVAMCAALAVINWTISKQLVVPTSATAQDQAFSGALSILVPAITLWLVYRMRSVGYLMMTFLGFTGVLKFIRLADEVDALLIVSLMLCVTMTISALIMRQKLFPYQNFLGIKKDENNHFIYK